jgi:hypothetical protein
LSPRRGRPAGTLPGGNDALQPIRQAGHGGTRAGIRLRRARGAGPEEGADRGRRDHAEFAPQGAASGPLRGAEPRVEIKIIQINEDTEAAHNARVAAGNPVDIRNNTIPVLENYKIYQNLLEIGYPHFDKLNYDARNIFEVTNGVPGYCPRSTSSAATSAPSSSTPTR